MLADRAGLTGALVGRVGPETGPMPMPTICSQASRGAAAGIGAVTGDGSNLDPGQRHPAVGARGEVRRNR
jgi:hypothetical protein